MHNVRRATIVSVGKIEQEMNDDYLRIIDKLKRLLDGTCYGFCSHVIFCEFTEKVQNSSFLKICQCRRMHSIQLNHVPGYAMSALITSCTILCCFACLKLRFSFWVNQTPFVSFILRFMLCKYKAYNVN